MQLITLRRMSHRCQTIGTLPRLSTTMRSERKPIRNRFEERDWLRSPYGQGSSREPSAPTGESARFGAVSILVDPPAGPCPYDG
jgi:hypothetical protein